MAFPTTGVLDNFNRANQGPPPSASWTTDILGFGDGGLEVISNVCAGDTAAFNNGWWNVADFGPDCEAHVTVATVNSVDLEHALYIRINNEGTSTVTGYYLRSIKRSGADEWHIRRVDNQSTFVTLGAAFTQEISAGDSMGIECIGSTIKAYYKAAAGSWTELASRTDATYGSAGRAGLEVPTATPRFDNFGGGTVVVPPVKQPFPWSEKGGMAAMVAQ